MTQNDAIIAVCAALASVAGSVTVMRGQSNAVRQGTPYISVIYIATAPVGFPSTMQAEATITAQDNQEARYQITAVGDPAVVALETFHALIQIPGSPPWSALRTAGVSVSNRGIIMDTGAFYKTGIEPRSMLDILVNYVWSAETTVTVEPAVAIDLTATNEVDEQSRVLSLPIAD